MTPPMCYTLRVSLCHLGGSKISLSVVRPLLLYSRVSERVLKGQLGTRPNPFLFYLLLVLHDIIDVGCSQYDHYRYCGHKSPTELLFKPSLCH